MPDETNPKDFENLRHSNQESIKGWGIDADPQNDPAYPMKMRTDEEQKGYSWERPLQQPEDVEILKSVERPNLTASFGTSTPPSGLSGIIRRAAYKYSESSYGRWLPLLLADRIGVVEGVLSDIAHGRIPNIIAERGWKAEWKHNRRGVITKAALTMVIAAAAIAVIAAPKKKKSGIFR